MEQAMAGRKPLGDRPMTLAERQARFRAAHADGAPKVRYRRPGDRRSRPQRWRDAVAELVELQDEYRTWRDSLPDNLAERPRRKPCGRSAILTFPNWRVPQRRYG